MALLVVLETLTPVERAVFVLHEVFGYAHTEIAEILGRQAPDRAPGPAAVLFDRDERLAVLVLDLTPDGDRIQGIYSVTNPDKLARIHDSQ